MEAERNWPVREYVLLLAGAVLCLLGFLLGLGWLGLLGGAALTGDGLLWALRERKLLAEMAARDRQAEEDLLRSVLRENEAREEGREALENYRSTLSHGLRMPIAVIQGYADLLRGDMVPDENTRRDYLDKIVQRTQLMAQLLSRRKDGDTTVEEGRLELDVQDMIALVRDISLDTQGYAAAHGISIQVLHSVTTLEAWVDKYLVSRMMYNLLENAVKYMGRPGTVTIRIWPQQEWAVVDVRDDGLGLPTAEVDHIFDLHFQGSNRVGGQGHGLYLVKKAVEAHHGKIEARSAPGMGLGIRIYLPREPEEKPEVRETEG